MDLIVEPEAGVSLLHFVLITLLVGGGAAWMTGRACALTWRPYGLVVAYAVLVAAAVRFLHMALFGGTLLSVHYAVVALVWTQVVAALGFRRTRALQMVSKYRWVFEPSGPLGWRARGAPSSTAP